MDIAVFNVDTDTRRRVSPDALAEAAASFTFAGECARCGRPLGTDGRFSLIAEEADPLLLFRVAHSPCAPAEHRQVSPLFVPKSTYRVLTIGGAGGVGLPPTLLVNPSVDLLAVMRDGRGPGSGYRLDLLSTLEDCGWTDPRRAKKIPLVGTFHGPDASGNVAVQTVAGTWAATLPPALRAMVRDRGLMAAVMHGTPVEHVEHGGWEVLHESILRGEVRVGSLRSTPRLPA